MLVRFEHSPVARPLLSDFFGFDRGIDSLFDGFPAIDLTARRSFSPAIDVAEYPSETVVIAEVPGMKKEDVKITFAQGVLTISGERKQHSVPEGSALLRSEFRTGVFSRSLEVSHEVNAGGITAAMTDGVLTITLPKAEGARQKQIDVKIT
jgi:HSP20 family protein